MGSLPGPGYPSGYVDPEVRVDPRMLEMLKALLLRQMLGGNDPRREVNSLPVEPQRPYRESWPVGPGGMHGVRG